MTNREWGDRLCRRLEAAIAKETPKGVGAHPPAWEVVKAETGALLAELLRIDRGEGDKETAKRLGLEVLAAWRRAVGEWEQEKRAA